MTYQVTEHATWSVLVWGLLALLSFLLLAVCHPSSAWAAEVVDQPESGPVRGVLTLDGGQVEVAKYGLAAYDMPQVEENVLPSPLDAIDGSEVELSTETALELDRDAFQEPDMAESCKSPDVQVLAKDYEVEQIDNDAVVELEQSGESASSIQNAANQIASNEDEMLATEVSATEAIEDEGLYWHEPNVVLATFEAGMKHEALEGLLNVAGGTDAFEVIDEDLAYGLAKLRITNGLSVLEAIERLSKVAGFLQVQPNYVYTRNDLDIAATVSDRLARNQWALKSVEAYEAWDQVKTNGSVAVAVIDTGADLDHPDLAPNIVATYNSLSTSNTVEDQLGHGTHVAGIIAGVANNGVGVAGVSYNANLVIIKATPFRSSDFDSASIVRAYAWLESYDSSGMTVAEHYNVRVVNLSLGGRDSEYASNLLDDVLHQAILKAREEYGILTVCAAGNGTSDNLPFAIYPGDSEACISVINLAESDDPNDANGVTKYDGSNYNVVGTKHKDLSAPGTKVSSTWLDGAYVNNTGTSMAAPLVAGIAAMVFAVNPNLTPAQVISILEATAIDLGEEGWDEVYGYGEVNAAAAVRLANQTRVEGWKAVGIGGTVDFSAMLGPGMTNPTGSWSWSVVEGGSKASINADGVLTGERQGEVTVVATCTTGSGAEISGTTSVSVVDARIVGNSMVAVGSASSEYTTDDSRWTWVWKVENGTGAAHIDQDAILHADRAGTVYVTATCSSNTDIVLRRLVVIGA